VELASFHPSSDQQREQLRRSSWAAGLAARLTREALTAARGETTERQIIDVNQAIAGMDSLPFQLENHQHTLVQEFGEGPLPVRLDPEQLELSLINLVRNAADAMSAGGTVKVATGAVPSSSWVEVAIVDTGVGIPSEIIERVTEPFFTTKATGRGTGLGLAVVRAFVEQAGGTLKIETAPGVGTTVRLLFPRATASEAMSPRDPQ
jgi:signal transduction histidine kinase